MQSGSADTGTATTRATSTLTAWATTVATSTTSVTTSTPAATADTTTDPDGPVAAVSVPADSARDSDRRGSGRVASDPEVRGSAVPGSPALVAPGAGAAIGADAPGATSGWRCSRCSPSSPGTVTRSSRRSPSAPPAR